MKNNNAWPLLDFKTLQPTLETLHHWIQIVGKIRLRTMPWQNHSWHTALYITSTGFSTHPIPYQGTTFQIDFDFKDHRLIIYCAQSEAVSFDLKDMSVANFYHTIFQHLNQLNIHVKIHAKPNEMDPAIPFAENEINKTYDKQAAHDIWKSMLAVNNVFQQFRSDYIGKSSPVHLFWGAFDLAVTRFSGEKAPLHPGGMPNMPNDVMQEAYSQEVSSAGFWLGSADFPTPVFYAYAYPSDESFSNQPVRPNEAFYSNEMGEFFLRYEDVVNSEEPETKLMAFLQSTYEAAANSANWKRDRLER